MHKFYYWLSLFSIVSLVTCQSQPQEIEVTTIVTQEVEVTRLVAVDIEGETMPDVVVMEVTRLVEVTPAGAASGPVPSAIGSEERPLRFVFPPIIPEPVVTVRAEAFFAELEARTGLTYETVLPETWDEAVNSLCEVPERTIAFLPPEVYLVSHERCGAQVGQAAARLGLPWHAGMIVVRNESGIETLADLADRTWAVASKNSPAGYFFLAAMLADAGIEVGEVIETNSENSALLAVYNGEADFATATYIPPILPFNERQWQYGLDDPEPWLPTLAVPVRSGVGYVIVNGDVNQGGYRLQEARAALLDTTPGIFLETYIVDLTLQIPYDTVTYSAAFPFAIANEVAVVLMDFARSETCATSICSGDFMNWESLQPVSDEYYDTYRFVVETLEISEEEILESGN